MQSRFSESRLRRLLRQKWNPTPVDPPSVDPNLEDLNPLSRSAETIRYSILSVEYWISPNGQVREWLRHNSRLAALLAIPAFLVLPIVTFALWQLVSWLGALNSIAGKLIVLPVLGLTAAILIIITISIFKSLFRN